MNIEMAEDTGTKNPDIDQRAQERMRASVMPAELVGREVAVRMLEGYRAAANLSQIRHTRHCHGMGRATQERIFEPFFTTKERVRAPVWA